MAVIIPITDFEDPRLDVYARLNENQLLNRHEPEKGLFIAESPKVVERALDAGCRPVSMLLEEKHVEGQAKEVIRRCGGIPVFTASFQVLTQLTGFHLTRGVLCAMLRPSLPSVEEKKTKKSRIVILEHIMNPTNVGAIFRSAAALGMEALLLTGDCSDPLYRRCIRVSMGAVFQIPWTYLKEPEYQWPGPAINALKGLGFQTAAMALRDDSRPIDDPEIAAKAQLAIVLGSEGDGLAPSTIADCDYTLKIPMSHQVDSLNVAAASAVAFWQLRPKYNTPVFPPS